MNFRLFITVLLIAMTLMSCEKEPTHPSASHPHITEVRNLKTQPVSICIDTTGHRIGYGTWITDPQKGEYLITARHLFEKSRPYYIGYSDAINQIYRPILRVDGKSTEVCVGEIGPVGTSGPTFSISTSQTIVDIEHRMRAEIKIQLTARPPHVFKSALEQSSFPSIAEWLELPDQIQVLDCFLGAGSSGTGFIKGGDSETFWVVAGMWPKTYFDSIKHLSYQPDPKGFTTICGLTWTQIEEARKSLFGK